MKTYGQEEYIGLDEDVLKTSSEHVWLTQICLPWSRRLEDILKRSSEDKDQRHFSRRLQDAFIKRKFWWDYLVYLWHPQLRLMLFGQWKNILLTSFLALDHLDFLITLIWFFKRYFLLELLNYWKKVVMKPFLWLLDQ